MPFVVVMPFLLLAAACADVPSCLHMAFTVVAALVASA
jgi:hypothetical protein